MSFILLFILMTNGLLLSCAMQPLGKGFNSRCMCVQLESRVIPPNNLRSVEIFPKGPHCKSTEVVASLDSGKRICLNPRTAWVKKLVHFIEKKESESKKESERKKL